VSKKPLKGFFFLHQQIFPYNNWIGPLPERNCRWPQLSDNRYSAQGRWKYGGSTTILRLHTPQQRHLASIPLFPYNLGLALWVL